MNRVPTPVESEIYGSFDRHVGPRFIAAGLGVQFHGNQEPGIHFKTTVPEEYRDAILSGIQDGLAERFPGFLKTGAVWITRVDADDIASSFNAFYRAARMVIEQAFFVVQPVIR